MPRTLSLALGVSLPSFWVPMCLGCFLFVSVASAQDDGFGDPSEPPPRRTRKHSLSRKVRRLSRQLSRQQRQIKALEQIVKLLQRQQRATQTRLQALEARSTAPAARRPAPPSKLPVFQAHGREVVSGVFVLQLSFRVPTTQIWYRLKHMKTFRSTGFFSLIHPLTGKPMPRPVVNTRKLQVGNNVVWVKYRDRNGKLIGPLRAEFRIHSKLDAVVGNFLTFLWANPSMRQIRVRYYRGSVMLVPFWTYNKALFRSVRYSVRRPTLDKTFVDKGKALTPHIRLKNLPEGVYSLFMRFTLRNGYKSKLLHYRLKLQDNQQWQNVKPQLRSMTPAPKTKAPKPKPPKDDSPDGDDAPTRPKKPQRGDDDDD